MEDDIDEEGKLIPRKYPKERVKEITITEKLLKETKLAAPVLVAKPGDLFEWESHRRDVVIEYVGRNELPPKKVKFRGDYSHNYYSPQIGWPIFRDHRESEYNDIDVVNGGIRDGIRAWPLAVYSHCDDGAGDYIKGTLCIPPEKCGALKVYEKPTYDDWDF